MHCISAAPFFGGIQLFLLNLFRIIVTYLHLCFTRYCSDAGKVWWDIIIALLLIFRRVCWWKNFYNCLIFG